MTVPSFEKRSGTDVGAALDRDAARDADAGAEGYGVLDIVVMRQDDRGHHRHMGTKADIGGQHRIGANDRPWTYQCRAWDHRIGVHQRRVAFGRKPEAVDLRRARRRGSCGDATQAAIFTLGYSCTAAQGPRIETPWISRPCILGLSSSSPSNSQYSRRSD